MPPKGAKKGVSIPVTDYEAQQDEELEFLAALFGDDFHRIQVKSAWKQSKDKVFTLRIHSLKSTGDEIFVVLHCRLTATYPKTEPILSLDNSNGLRPKSLQTIKSIIKAKPHELVEFSQPMINEIAAAIQEVIDNEAEFHVLGDAIPSFEEQRAEKEQVATEKAAKELAIRQKKEEEEAAKRLTNEVATQFSKQKHRKKTVPEQRDNTIVHQKSSDTHIHFGRVVKYHIEGSTIEFSTVKGFTRLAKGPVTEVFTVQPDVSNVRSQIVKDSAPALLAVKCSAGNYNPSETSTLENDPQKNVKAKIVVLEEQLNELRSHHSPTNCLRILDFVVNLTDDSWNLHILTEYANRGSLEDFLQITSLTNSRIRSWTFDLLEALEFIDRRKLVHGRIHAKNILLCQGDNGACTIKLADAVFQDTLYDLQKQSNKTRARAVYWTAPELLNEDTPKKTHKTDVWDLGIVFLQMIFGLEVPERYQGPRSLLKSNSLSESLESVITRFFHETPRRRSTATELRSSGFFFLDETMFLSTESVQTKSHLIPQTPRLSERRSSRQSMSHALSRYNTEWEEVRRLGKGGFGEVVLARNKTDKSTYAIKKIHHKTSRALERTVTEVMVFSKLNDPNVVRYFTAWYEPDSNFINSENGSMETEDVDTEETHGQPPTQTNFKRLDVFSSSRAFGKGSFAAELEQAIVSSSEDESEEEEDDDSEDSDDDEDDEDDDDDEEESEDDSVVDFDANPFEAKFSDDVFAKSGKNKTFSEDIFGTNPEEPSERQSESQNVKRITSRSDQPQCLYIQMEYCPGESLRELLNGRRLEDNEIWDLFRQIVKGLNHIHQHAIIHRDLKPENIFLDAAGTAKIGDFGLSTIGRENNLKQRKDQTLTEQSRDIGTALYIAPEVRSGSKLEYTTKADMFTLGLILAEMCYYTTTAMGHTLLFSGLRKSPPELPADFNRPENFRPLIASLVNEAPDIRPSCEDLLKNDSIPIKVQDEAIKEALKALHDTKSPYHKLFLEEIFSSKHSSDVQSTVWDASYHHKETDPNLVALQELVKDRVKEVFRNHGAIEVERDILLPQSHVYTTDEEVVRLLEHSGISVQLPYDLTLPNARSVARAMPPSTRTYTIGNVFRQKNADAAINSIPCANFDIVTTDVLDIALKESEVIKVLDEVVQEASQFKKTIIHINHSDLLDEILNICRIPPNLRTNVKEILGSLRIVGSDCPTWAVCSIKLKAAKVSDSSVADLQKWDWKAKPDRAIERLKKTLDADIFDRLSPTLNHLVAVYNFTRKFHIASDLFLSPLSNYSQQFYKGGVMFQCLSERQSPNGQILAFGGRYDVLISQEKPPLVKSVNRHAVGASILLEELYKPLETILQNSRKSKGKKKGSAEKQALENKFLPRRCAVLVASFDAETLRSVGLQVLSNLWQAKIGAELAVDATSLEMLQALYAGKKEHRWIVLIKKSDAAWGAVEVRVKSLLRDDMTSWQQQGVEVPIEGLIAHIRSEMAIDNARDHNNLASLDASLSPLSHQPSATTTASLTAIAPVMILRGETKTKKVNRNAVIDAARSAAASLLATAASAQIIAVELSDEIFEAAARLTRLSDPESWRRVREMAEASERAYLLEVQELLQDLRRSASGKVIGGKGESNGLVGGRYAVLFQFKSGAASLYDLEA